MKYPIFHKDYAITNIDEKIIHFLSTFGILMVSEIDARFKTAWLKETRTTRLSRINGRIKFLLSIHAIDYKCKRMRRVECHVVEESSVAEERFVNGVITAMEKNVKIPKRYLQHPFMRKFAPFFMEKSEKYCYKYASLLINNVSETSVNEEFKILI